MGKNSRIVERFFFFKQLRIRAQAQDGGIQ